MSNPRMPSYLIEQALKGSGAALIHFAGFIAGARDVAGGEAPLVEFERAEEALATARQALGEYAKLMRGVISDEEPGLVPIAGGKSDG